MTKEDIVYYGYPGEPEYKELVNLILTHDKIYDANDILTPLLPLSPNLAELLDNLNNPNKISQQIIELLNNEDKNNYSTIFLLISSIFQYNGLHPREWWTIPRHGERFMNERILSIDKLKEVNKKNSMKFIDIIIPSLNRAFKKNPNAINRSIVRY